MAHDSVPTAQLADEPADLIPEQQPQHRSLKEHPHTDENESDKKEIEDRRHRSSDAMADSTKSMMATYPVNPAQNIQLACAKETIQFCYSEAMDAIVTFEKSAYPDDARSTLRIVNLRLARNANSLSQPCLASLVQTLQFLPAPSMSTPTYAATGAVGGWTPPTSGNTGEYRGGGNSEPNREKHQRRDHQRFRHNHGDDDEDDGGSGVHPLVWAFILPFFFIGLIVVLKKGVKCFQEWQRARLMQQGVQREGDYAPLKTEEPS